MFQSYGSAPNFSYEPPFRPCPKGFLYFSGASFRSLQINFLDFVFLLEERTKMQFPTCSQNSQDPEGPFLTPTSGSGLKHRIRELECIIDSELRSLQRQVQQFKSQKIVQVSNSIQLVGFIGESIISGLHTCHIALLPLDDDSQL